MKQKKGYVVPHTHWDREWRYPIWENRMYLVDLMEELMDTLEQNPDYRSFLLDGQVIAVLDYLQMRPENRERLTALIRAGRIQIGPWYTLPDLYPISGESIVRNLLKGRREAEKLGGCLNVGYESFGWGQPSQLPQIYRGFGIDTVIVSKNVDKTRAPQCEFKWTGADGTSVYATRLGDEARANFFMNAYLPIMNGKDYHSDEYLFQMGCDGQVFHQADEAEHHNDYFKLESTERIHPEQIKASVEKAWQGMHSSLMPEDRVMMDGTDSTTAQPQLMRLLREINKQFEEIDFVSSSIGEYVKVLKERLPLSSLLEIKGEMRDGPTTSLSGNALMTRPHIKALNKQVQNLLFGEAEPFSVVAGMLGARYDVDFLNLALQYLLLSHPHDSINGVTQDKTVEDVLYRLHQAQELAQTVYNRSCQKILKSIDLSCYQRDDILLVVFNPYPKPRRQILRAYLDTPQQRNIWDFQLEDSQGSLCQLQEVARTEVTVPVAHLQARPFPYYADRHCILFDTGEIPAGGYQVYRVKPVSFFNRKTEFWAKTRTTDGKELARSTTDLENEYLLVHVNDNGTLRLTDKENGQVYDHLNSLESTGDVGDYWMYYPPYHNQTHTSKGCKAQIFLTENGNLSATVGVKLSMRLPSYAYRPENYLRGKSERASETKEVPVTIFYTLHKNEKKVQVKLEIDNTVEDHKMSVLFATGVQAERADAQGHFTVDRRDVLPRRDTQGRYYNELTTQPMQSFVSLSDEQRGVSVLTDCMGEYEARQDEEKTLSLTLFRAVRNIICTEWRSAGVFPNQHGGQLQQKLTYHYAICVHPGTWQQNDILTQAEEMNIPLKPVQTCIPVKGIGTLPTRHSFYQVEGKLFVSCIKRAEDRDSIVVRLFNPSDGPAEGRFIWNPGIEEAYQTDCNEQRLQPLPISNERGIQVRLQPNEIITMDLVIKGEWI